MPSVMNLILGSSPTFLSYRTWYPTSPPRGTLSSCATLVAVDVTATRRGCVTATAPGCAAHIGSPYPDSYKNWGTCVVLPHPVSPQMTVTGLWFMWSTMSCSEPRIGRPSRAACMRWVRLTSTGCVAPTKTPGNFFAAAVLAASFAAASCAAASLGSSAAATASGPSASVAASAACAGSRARIARCSSRAVAIAVRNASRAAASSAVCSSRLSSSESSWAMTRASACANLAASNRAVSMGCMGPYSSTGAVFVDPSCDMSFGHDAFAFVGGSGSIGSSSSLVPTSSRESSHESSSVFFFSRLWSLESSVPGSVIPARSALSSRRSFSLAVSLCPSLADPASSVSDSSLTSLAASSLATTAARSSRLRLSSSTLASLRRWDLDIFLSRGSTKFPLARPSGRLMPKLPPPPPFAFFPDFFSINTSPPPS
mmetsp:Transcript_3009/g.11834  ORF Transcript_3009/g.11834 Transcript_3009/m.11834 type:complete len:427 (+) Transcript_3009:3059-4339(+)